MTEVKFFIYGSMTEGLVHFQKISDFIVHSIPATIRGTAYRLKVGFPVVLEQGEDVVPGSLVTLRMSDLLLQLLDQFHGYREQDESKSLYFRRIQTVHLSDGTQDQAFSYVLNPLKLPANSKQIVGGNWQDSLSQLPALTDTLSERQRAYILRLGASTGREIVPIDLPLYRELMNLEMIVDKGRRLALSKLGHEVYRYLG